MPYGGMTPKQKRIVEQNVEGLFSPTAFISNPTIEDIKRLGIVHPSVKFNRKTLLLSEKGEAALRRLADLISGLPVLSSSVSTGDIRNQVLRSYNNWIETLLQPTGQEFIDGVADALLGVVKDYQFLARIEGIDLKDQDVLELGSFRIVRSNRALLETVKFGGNIDLDSVYQQFKDSLWLIGTCKGSSDVASEQFEYGATLIVGVLAVSGAILYKGAIWRSRVRVVISPHEHRSPISLLRWETGGDNPSLSHRWAEEQDLPLDIKSVIYLNQVCFLKELASLPERTDRNELQDGIVRSLYWFADAYRDRNPTMQFIKLWSCAECFFAIKKEEVTELNAKGIAAILTFAGFNIVDVEGYPEFKRRLKSLYGLRSAALHRAQFGHIQTSDLNDLSRWVAWMIISMVSLSERGYKTLAQIHEQISRLDQLATTKNL